MGKKKRKRSSGTIEEFTLIQLWQNRGTLTHSYIRSTIRTVSVSPSLSSPEKPARRRRSQHRVPEQPHRPRRRTQYRQWIGDVHVLQLLPNKRRIITRLSDSPRNYPYSRTSHGRSLVALLFLFTTTTTTTRTSTTIGRAPTNRHTHVVVPWHSPSASIIADPLLPRTARTGREVASHFNGRMKIYIYAHVLSVIAYVIYCQYWN